MKAEESLKELLSLLIQLAISPKEREILEVIAKQGVRDFSLICKHMGLSTGYTSVVLKRLISKGILIKQGKAYNFTNNNLFFFFKFDYKRRESGRGTKQ